MAFSLRRLTVLIITLFFNSFSSDLPQPELSFNNETFYEIDYPHSQEDTSQGNEYRFLDDEEEEDEERALIITINPTDKKPLLLLFYNNLNNCWKGLFNSEEADVISYYRIDRKKASKESEEFRASLEHTISEGPLKGINLIILPLPFASVGQLKASLLADNPIGDFKWFPFHMLLDGEKNTTQRATPFLTKIDKDDLGVIRSVAKKIQGLASHPLPVKKAKKR